MTSDYFRRHVPIDDALKRMCAKLTADQPPGAGVELAYVCKRVAGTPGARYASATGRNAGTIIPDP
jgi:hypothetical protein